MNDGHPFVLVVAAIAAPVICMNCDIIIMVIYVHIMVMVSGSVPEHHPNLLETAIVEYLFNLTIVSEVLGMHTRHQNCLACMHIVSP